MGNGKAGFLLATVLLIGSVSAQEGAKYLIISADQFLEQAEELARWKTKKGIKARVVPLSEVGSSTIAIHNFVVDAYNDWDIRPEYLLLFGDATMIPFKSYNYTFTDCYYTDVDGDLYNEIIPGRLPASNATEAQVMVMKILSYERDPYMSDTTWFIQGLGIVREDGDPDDSIYWGDIKHAASLMVDAGFLHVDTFSYYRGDNWQEVKAAINQGRAYAYYRGSATCLWYTPFYFRPRFLHNGFKLPIVVSATCGQIDPYESDCGEQWLKAGSPEELKGAAGFVGTTTSGMGLALYRSSWSRGFFDAVFQSDTTVHFGRAVEAGRRRVYETYMVSAEYRGLTCIGDPEMNLWTSVPHQLQVFYPRYLPEGPAEVTVMVKDHNGIPVKGALVCLMQDTLIYLTDLTNIEGTVDFDFDISSADSISITVTYRNHLPYEEYIRVLTCSPGDCNGDGSVTQTDLVYLTNFLFCGGPPPPICADTNGDCSITAADLNYLAAYIFGNGPEPLIPCSVSGK